MGRFLSAILILVVLIFTISFTVINAHEVQINYYLGTSTLPLALLLVLSVALGALLGAVAVMSMVFRLRWEIAKLRRTAKLTEKEVSNLRSMPIKEPH